MTDVVSKKTRSRMMSGIRGKDTKPELLVRRALHNAGYRYRLHYKDLPGRPDLVLPKYKAAVFINGCFWHAHNCHLFRLPKSNTAFWKEKIGHNIKRDKKNIKNLIANGWRVLIVWECSVKGKTKIPIDSLLKEITYWLQSSDTYKEIPPNTKPANLNTNP